ncbi:MMPL family transporter [Nocardia pseudobrasiliensis]|uniref:RND superfamily putative drug exporter n=1 Tax=Nocardia pseudobrasiliensis TaxID=45979 RepID=A0A370IBQ0_9NOCA|nr:MMPL family transporter [Nocardia pseudobrasiliensis]RDI68137.1 RND superfamily putative drug exporter [Nocardia pseudobrasiliensis]
MVLTALARFALRFPRAIASVALLLGVGATVLAIPAVTGLPAGGFDVPTSESIRAEQVLDERFDAGGMPLVFTVTAADGVDSPAARERGESIVAALRNSPYAKQILSYWTTPQQQLAEPLVGADRHTGLVIARIVGGDKYAPARARDLAKSLELDAKGVTVAVGGPAMAYSDVEQQSRWDLVRFEAIVTPITFLALVWIFGSAVAAFLPLAIALLATVGTTAVLWQIYQFTNVSVFATNIATAVCLALAVDYTLFILNRYREELSHGASTERALIIAMNTAGRTVTYSALTMALTLSAMAVFPQYLLRSLAYGGVTAVLLSLLGALVLAPALIVLLGSRIDAFDIRRLLRRRRPAPTARVESVEERSIWYRIATFASRRPLAVVGGSVIVLLLLGLPFLGVKLAYPDDRNLPTTTLSRQAGDILRSDFTQNYAGTAQAVLPAGVKSPADVTGYAMALSTVDGVLRVTGPNGIYERGKVISAATFDSALKGDSAYLTIATDRDPYSDAGKAQLSALKSVRAPAPTLFGGMTQRNIDNLHGFTDRIPLVLAIIVAITLILTFMMTGSILLPLKVLITNAVSLTAAGGVVVWIFQDGHLGGLGTVVYGHTGVIVPVLLLCIAYALSMDYAVFVLSRVQEEWSRSGRTRADNNRAVALGLARTGRIVTAAAVVMVIVFLGLSAGQVSFMRSLGVGLMVSVIVDAFFIRVLVVPGLMALLGRANWWAPEPMRRWYERHGLRETDNPAPVAAVRAEAGAIQD